MNKVVSSYQIFEENTIEKRGSNLEYKKTGVKSFFKYFVRVERSLMVMAVILVISF